MGGSVSENWEWRNRRNRRNLWIFSLDSWFDLISYLIGLWFYDGRTGFLRPQMCFFGNILHRFEATLSCLDKNMCRPFRSHVCSTWKANAREALPGIPSMGLVYLPTWMVDFYGFHAGKYIDIHGWYGIRSVPQPVFLLDQLFSHISSMIQWLNIGFLLKGVSIWNKKGRVPCDSAAKSPILGGHLTVKLWVRVTYSIYIYV